MAAIFKGTTDDVTLCHYGACGTCRIFGDAFYVMAPATIAHIREQRRWSRMQACHGRGVTKAGGP